MSYASARAASTYLQTATQSRTPLELVVMLYDGALRFIGTARAALDRGDVRARTDAISRALAIVSELQNTLDMDAGGEIATQLDELYRFVIALLMDASFRQDAAALDLAERTLREVRSGWAAIAAGTTGGSEPAR